MSSKYKYKQIKVYKIVIHMQINVQKLIICAQKTLYFSGENSASTMFRLDEKRNKKKKSSLQINICKD